MATGPGVNQGKGKFLRDFLPSNRDASVEAVTAAWAAEGHDNGISESLISKIKSELGLTGKKRAGGGATEAGTGTAAKGKAKPSPKGATGKPTSKKVEASSQPADRDINTGPSRSAFVEEVLGREPEANLGAVNEAWTSQGNEGSISPSIFYKVKREQGVTDEIAPPAPAKPQPESASKGTGAGQAARATEEAGPEPDGVSASSKSAGSPRSADRERVLDRVEDGIDDLIVELKRLGGMEAALESLKKVRRVVVRSHEG